MRFGTKILCGLVIVLMICAVPVAAYSLLSNGNTENGNRPAVLVEYGTGKDLGLVKVTHIHYAKPADRTKPVMSSSCTKLAGWKWSGPLTYTVAPDPALKSAIVGATGEWEAHTSRDLFSDPAEGTFPSGARDSVNSVSFGKIAQGDVIAITTTWFSRGTKTAVESDIQFNTAYTWGMSGDSSLMDIQNIATHETGHTLGLDDIYVKSCSPVTMFGYSNYGDTAKRTVEIPDVAGLQKLYGA